MQKEILYPGLKSSVKYDIKKTNEKENYSTKKEDAASHRRKTVKGPRKDKFQCRVAIFDEKEDPNKKLMYPKHLVYVDGKDIQLEEIQAMHYWNGVNTKGDTNQPLRRDTKQFRDISTQTEIETLKTKIQKVQVTENFTQTESNVVPVKETSTQTNFISTNKYSQTDSSNLNHLQEVSKKSTDAKEISIQTIPLNSSSAAEKKNKLDLFSRTVEVPCPDPDDTITPSLIPSIRKCETITISERKKKKSIESKQFIHENDGMLSNFNNLDDEDEETIIDTRAFKVLPSSTPYNFNRRSNELDEADTSVPFEIVEKNESIQHTKSHVNLSMIVELSKEIYSQSTTMSKIDLICSKTFALPNHRVIDQNEESDDDNFNLRSVTNPFDDNVIQHLLLNISFPTGNHLPGYSHFDCDIPNLRSKCSIELGADKYTISGEIGEGAYAKILRIHPEYNNSKSMALKHQEPPCLWEWYINKEIFNRLIEADKKQLFMEYSRIYVFKNASLILSDWAPYGNILNLLNTIRNSKNFILKDRCPMSVCIYLSIQMISSLQYLHSCEIIHGDVKPDNFVLLSCSSNSSLRVKLMDFGRSIDMKLFPPGKTFNYVVSTENFTCNEMKEQKPWTYQTDLYGLAGTIYILLVGKYMTTQKKNGEWNLDKTLPRYYYPDVWMPIFHKLLNIPSCYEQPNLSELKKTLDEFFSHKIGKFTLSREMNSLLTVLNQK